MARVTRKTRRNTKTRKSVKKRTSRITTRKAGAYGLYRGTGFTGIRQAVRSAYLTPFPNQKLVRHKYCDVITISGGGGAGIPTHYSFRANSMYDPDYSGVGHQPMFRDEMAAQYTQYTVLQSWIKLSFLADSGTALTLLLWTDDDHTLPATQIQACENHRAFVAQKLDKRTAPLRLKGWYDAAKWIKTTRAGLMADDKQRTSIGSNPAAEVARYFNCQIWPHNPADTVPLQKVHVEMFFVTVWREPVEHGTS